MTVEYSKYIVNLFVKIETYGLALKHYPSRYQPIVFGGYI